MPNELTQEAVNISSVAVPQPAALVVQDVVVAFADLNLTEKPILYLFCYLKLDTTLGLHLFR